jgi:hypothetical protein
MPFIDLRDLIVGILVVISVAIGVGKLDALHDFAKKEAVKTLHGWPAYHFFPSSSVDRKFAK